MKLRKLGNSSLEVAPLAFGGNVFGWTIDEATSFNLLDAFVDAGFNLIDTADVYSHWKPGNQGGESETMPARDLGEKDRRLSRLALREDDAVLAVLVGPVLEQLAGDRRDAAVLTITTPLRNVPPDLVDQLVALPAFAGDVEVDRLLNRLALLALLGHGDRDPGLTRPAAVLDLPGRPVLSDLVMPGGLRVRRVEDWVFYGFCLAAAAARVRPSS